MAVERTNHNGVVSQQHKEVTTGTMTIKKEYQPQRILSGLERLTLQKKMFDRSINWSEHRQEILVILNAIKNYDCFNHTKLEETFNKRDRIYRIAKIKERNLNRTIAEQELVVV